MSLFYNKVPAHGAFFISKPFCLFSNYVAGWKNVPIFAAEITNWTTLGQTHVRLMFDSCRCHIEL